MEKLVQLRSREGGKRKEKRVRRLTVSLQIEKQIESLVSFTNRSNRVEEV